MASSSKNSIPGNDLLTAFENQGGVSAKLGIFLRRYVLPTINTAAQASAVSPKGQLPPPAPPESINVTSAGEMMQVSVNHSAPIIRGVHYIYHMATNPAFLNGQIEVKAATRAPMHFVAPTFQGDGTTKHSYYHAVQVQYPGGPPSQPTYFGGGSPTPVTLNGATALDIQPGTGSGTASNGGQTFQGLGRAPIRH